jgi:type IV secretion system protein VirD4
MILSILQSLGDGVAGVLSELFSSNNQHRYSAAFGSESQHLSRFNHGFAVTGAKALTKQASHTNCALFGPTGSGKSSSVIIPSIVSLARAHSSIIINDVSGEVYDATSAYLQQKGYSVLRLDFSNAACSETFNPLSECRSIADIQKVALLIIRNALGESKNDPFWEQSAIMLISLFGRLLVFHQPPQYRTLHNVLRLIETFSVNGTAVDRLIVLTRDEELLTAYKATVAMSDKTLQSVIATARTALNLFCDPEVCKTTATNSIDFSRLRKDPVALYVCNPLKDLMYFKPLSALFFQSLFNYVLSRIPSGKERSIFFLLDECATMTFPNLSTTVSNIRKFSAGLLLCMQDEMSLISRYGATEAHQIKTNCGTQVFLKGQPLHTCKELAQVLGKYTYTDEKGVERTRELMTPDEIRMSEEAIILIGNAAPLKCKMVPYFENITMSGLGRSTPLTLEKKQPAIPPLIQFS